MLDAAEELLQSGGPRKVTLENVVKLSGATVGSFYARFGNVEGLFDALHKRYMDSIYDAKLLESLNRSVSQPDLESALRSAIKTMIEFGYDKRKLLHYFVTQEIDSAVEIRRTSVNIMLEIVKAFDCEVVHSDLRRVSENTARLIYHTFTGVILLEPSKFTGRKTSLSSVIESTTQMAYQYLTNE